jgi:hypothetical protein
MNLLPLTLFFIMVFAFLGTLRNQEQTSLRVSDALFTATTLNAQKKLGESLFARANRVHYELNAKPQDQDKHIRKSKFLLLNGFVQKTDQKQVSEKAAATKILFKRLLLELYGKKEFFRTTFQSDAPLDEFIEELQKGATELADKDAIKRIQDFGNIGFSSSLYQSALYKILKGKIPPDQKEADADDEYPPLANYARLLQSTSQASIASVYRASPELIHALFVSPDVIQKVLHKREEIEAQIYRRPPEERSDLRNLLNEEFRMQFQGALSPDVPSAVIDFEVSGPQD